MRSKRKKLLNNAIILLILSIVLFQYYNNNINKEVLALLYFSVISFLPLIFYFLKEKPDILEIDVIAFSYMGIGFILRYISLQIDPYIDPILSKESMVNGIFSQAIMCTGFMLGYSLVKKFKNNKLHYNKEDINISNSITIISYIMIIISRLYLLSTNNVIVYAFSQEVTSNIIVNYCKTISSLGVVICGLMYFKYLVNGSIKKKSIIVAIFFEIIWSLLMGAKTSLIELLIMLMMSKLYASKTRIKPKQILIAIISILIIFVTINGIRDSYKSLQNSDTSFKSIFSNMLISNNKDKDILDTIMPIISRSDILDSISLIVEKTPSIYPYRHGKQYIDMIFIPIIPGSIWKDKPEYKDGLYNSWYYREKPREYYTHYAAGITGGFYWNFGLMGSTVAMFLVGVIYSSFYCWFVTRGIKKDIYFILYGAIFLKIIQMEVTFYNIYLNCFQILIVCIGIDIIDKFLRKAR